MGSGKGNVEFWVAVVKPGKVLFELNGLSNVLSNKALKIASYKLPVSCRIIYSL
jgi:large subunit ribosomal protein L16